MQQHAALIVELAAGGHSSARVPQRIGRPAFDAVELLGSQRVAEGLEQPSLVLLHLANEPFHEGVPLVE